MTATVPHSDRLTEIGEEVRSAWSAYGDRVRTLHGDEYEQTEAEAWVELQYELDRLERAREELIAAGAVPQGSER